MPRILELVGHVFGKLTVIRKTEQRSSIGLVLWECRCECGNTCVVNTNKLRQGHKTSCGCVRKVSGRPSRVKQLRERAITTLGAKCVECGYDTDIRALQIDHKNGGGGEERRRLSMRDIYRRVLDYPMDYQVLCANCNMIKGRRK